jgi:hypothetical protein
MRVTDILPKGRPAATTLDDPAQVVDASAQATVPGVESRGPP